MITSQTNLMCIQLCRYSSCVVPEQKAHWVIGPHPSLTTFEFIRNIISAVKLSHKDNRWDILLWKRLQYWIQFWNTYIYIYISIIMSSCAYEALPAE